MHGILDDLMDWLFMLALACPPKGREVVHVPPPEPQDGESEYLLPKKYSAMGSFLRDEILVPEVRSRIFGRVGRLETKYLVPHCQYVPRHEVLSIMTKGFRTCRRAYRQTAYYHDQQSRHGARRASLKVARYYRLLGSVRKNGFNGDPVTRRNLPVAFCAKDIVFRLDGCHRCSVARFLGYASLPVVVVQPEDVLSLPSLPPEIESLMKSLSPSGDIEFLDQE